MAKNEYTNKLGIDTSEFKRAMSEINANLKNLKSQINYATIASDSYNGKIELLTKNIDENVKKEKLLEEELERVKNATEKDVKAIASAEEKLYKQKSATALARQDLDKFKESHENAGKAQDIHKVKIDAVSRAMYDLAKAITEKACQALVDLTKNSVETGIRFESAFAGVKKVVDGTEKDFIELEEEIRKTSLEKPISADQLASIYQMGAQLGIAKNDLKDFSNTVIDLKNTSDLTEEAGATMIAQYANVKGLKSSEYQKFASTLSYLGSTTATSESRIMSMAQRMSGTAAVMKMADKDVLALATSMSSVGIEAELGGSAISKVMMNIEEAVEGNTDKLSVWASTAKMSVSDFANLWKSDKLGAIQKVMKGLSDSKAGGESLVLMLKDLGIENIRTTQTMMQLSSASDLLTDCMQKANKEWNDAAFLSKSANEVYKTTESQIQILKNSFDEIKISIFKSLQKPLQDAITQIKYTLQDPKVKESITNFAKQIGNVVLSIIKNLDKIIPVIKTVTKAITGMIATFTVTKIVTGIMGMVTSFYSLTKAIQAGDLAMKILNGTMAANPIGAVVTVIGLLVTGITLLAAKTDDSTSKLKEHTKALEEQKDQLIANRVEREKTIAGIDAEANHTQGLVNELKTLVDENGKVKEGQKERLNTILPLTQNATGVEIECINGQITKYNELIGTLDQVIAKKRLEAKINAYQGDYEEAIRGIEGLEDELKDKKDNIVRLEHEINERVKYQSEKALAGEGRSLYGYANETLRLQNKLAEYKKQRDELIASKSEFDKTINKYEGLITEQYNTFGNGSKTSTNTGSASNAGSAAGQAYVQGFSSAAKEGTKTTYQELLNQEKAYGDQLKDYLSKVKDANSGVTVEMVQDTKKKLEETQKKVKEMKELLGDNTVTSKLVLNDETYGGLTKKRQELKDQLFQLQTELANGNQSITQDMLNNVGKQIDQVEAKMQNLKNEWDESGADGEISDEFESENTNHVSKGVIFGKGVLGDNAVEIEGAGKDAAGKYLDAFLKEKEDKKNQIAISAIEQANAEATNYQLATIDPNNLAIYDTTERLLAESKQTSQAQGLVDNAYKVVDAETWTLNQAIEAAKQIDYAQIGKFMCEGISRGISENAHLVVSAVRTMMAAANSSAEDEEEIASPSKVFYKYGKFMDLGLANGIRDYASEVSTQVHQMTSRANEAISLANDQMKSERLGSQQVLKGSGPTEINYNFVQNNT